MGRPRKLQPGDIAMDEYNGHEVAVVGYKITRTEREYRVVPLDRARRRAGHSYWQRSRWLLPVGSKSAGSVKTYNANYELEKEIGRGCTCECCVHEAYDLTLFSTSGKFRT